MCVPMSTLRVLSVSKLLLHCRGWCSSSSIFPNLLVIIVPRNIASTNVFTVIRFVFTLEIILSLRALDLIHRFASVISKRFHMCNIIWALALFRASSCYLLIVLNFIFTPRAVKWNIIFGTHSRTDSGERCKCEVKEQHHADQQTYRAGGVFSSVSQAHLELLLISDIAVIPY